MAEGDPAFRLRLLSALALVPIALTLVVSGGWGFAGLIEIAVVLMALEWSKLTRATYGEQSAGYAGLAVLAVGLVSTLLVALEHPGPGLVVLAAGAAVAGLLAPALKAPPLWVAAGVGYVGLPALALIWLRSVPELGLTALIWLLAVVWSTDTGAYFAGRRLGGPRLAPTISPAKTWSGFVGGILAAVVASTLVAALAGASGLLLAAVLGAVLAVVAQLGDLAESALKRRAGVKDTGTLIPGHGGVLDRVDGLLFAAPVLALFCLLAGPAAWPWR